MGPVSPWSACPRGFSACIGRPWARMETLCMWLISTPRNGPNAPLVHWVPILPRFGVFWAVRAHEKWVHNQFKKVTLDHLGCL